MNAVAEIRKAATALIVGLIGWATAVIQSSSDGITAAEWIGLLTVFAAAAGVYQVTNAPPTLTPAQPPPPAADALPVPPPPK